MGEKLPNPTEHEAATLGGRTYTAWHQHLTGEDLATPGSRYGRTASECAWWAVAAMAIYEHYYPGEMDDPEGHAQNAMSMAVNDHASLQPFIVEHRDVLPTEVVDNLTVEGGQ